MAMQKKANQRSSTGLVPPPPAIPMPTMGQYMGQPKFQAMTPIMDMGMQQSPQVGAPQMAMPQMAAPIQAQAVDDKFELDPEAYNGFMDNLRQTQTVRDNLAQQLKDFPVFTPTENAQPSPEQQQINAYMQNQMMDLMSNKESLGDRFDRGFARGQKIAGSVVVPLIGALTGKGGMAMGLNEATNALKSHADAELAATASRKQQRNALLMQMANMWQTMDPNSQKNMLALSRENLAQQKANAQEKQALQREFLTAAAQHNNMLAQGAKLKMRSEAFDQKKGVDAEKLSLLKNKTDASIGHMKNQDSIATERLGLAKNADKRGDANLKVQQTYADIAQQSNSRANAKVGADAEKDKRNFSFKQREHADKQDLAVANLLNTMARQGNAVDQLGQPKDPNAAQRFNSPLFQRVLQNAMDKSSLKGVSAAELLPALIAKPAASPAATEAGPQDALQSIASQAVGAISNKLLGKPGGKPQPKFESASQAATAFVQEHGRKPTPDELRKYAGVQ